MQKAPVVKPGPDVSLYRISCQPDSSDLQSVLAQELEAPWGEDRSAQPY